MKYRPDDRVPPPCAFKGGRWSFLFVALTCFTALPTASSFAADATEIVRSAFVNWRADSSHTSVTMVVHRPDWERTSVLKAWTEGGDKSLVRFIKPAKDRGNAILKMDSQMWMYNPKLRQITKLPASVLSQSWMGSDFSYNDLSKSEDLLTEYTHEIIESTHQDGHDFTTIEALPKPGAAIVWGKQIVQIRDDGVLMKETYFDQDMNPVRVMTTETVAQVGGRPYPTVMVMRPSANPDQWTKIETTEGVFNQELPDYVFTRSNLENPRD